MSQDSCDPYCEALEDQEIQANCEKCEFVLTVFASPYSYYYDQQMDIVYQYSEKDLEHKTCHCGGKLNYHAEVE